MKKVFSLLIAVLFSICLLTSCGGNAQNVSSALVSSEVAQSEENSSQKSENDDKQNSSTVTTNSQTGTNSATQGNKTSSENKPLIDRESSTVSESQSVKVYKNNGNVQLGAYTFRLDQCNSNGEVYEAQLEEFTDVVNEGYFNTYFLSLNEDILAQMKPIAEAGGTVWFASTRNIKEKGLDAYIENVEYYLDLLDKAGYRDLVNGFYWYEPLWQSTLSNDDFLQLTKTIYQKFGLRNFPAFAPHNFSDLTGTETNEQADAENQILTENLKYVTDVAVTVYGVDARDGVKVSSGTLNKWQTTISPSIQKSSDYYTGYKEKLHAHVGHPVNTWYYACAYETGVSVGLNGLLKSDEDYCIGHLEFMAEDVLNSEYQGGIVLHKYSTTGSTTALQHRLPIKDSRGKYKYYTSHEKWENYAYTLKKVREQFDSVKAKTVKL